jgi:hypothetical protein
MPADPPEAMAQGTHGEHAMDVTCQGVVEGGAHLFEYDPDDPGGSRDDRSCCPVRRRRQLVPGRRGDRLR